MIDQAVADVEAQLESWQVPGVELVVVRDGEVLFAGGVGVRGTDDAERIGPRTLFQHGSCGKAFTGLLGALLAEDGVIDLDAPVRRYVPELRLADSYVADHVTMRDLLSHRSGLGRHDLLWIFDQGIERAELVRRLEFLPLAHEPRATWSYSNLGFTLAGHAMGRATGSTWEEQLQLRVLDPLGMTRTYTAYDKVPVDDVARPHVLRDGKPVQGVVRRFNGPAPAGQLISCAADTIRWLLLQCGDPLLSQDAVGTTHTAAIVMPADAIPYREIALVGYGLGWAVGTYRGRPARWHSGGVDGFSTQTLVLPEQRIGVLASASLNSTQLPFAAILHLADAALGETSAPSWFDRMRSLDEEEPAKARTTSAGTGPAHPLSDYEGTYRHPAYGDLAVAVVAGELRVRIGDADLQARHRTYETWDLRYAALDVDVTVTFGAAPDGRVVDAVAPLDDGSEPIRFRRPL